MYQVFEYDSDTQSLGHGERTLVKRHPNLYPELLDAQFEMVRAGQDFVRQTATDHGKPARYIQTDNPGFTRLLSRFNTETATTLYRIIEIKKVEAANDDVGSQRYAVYWGDGYTDVGESVQYGETYLRDIWDNSDMWNLTSDQLSKLRDARNGECIDLSDGISSTSCMVRIA